MSAADGRVKAIAKKDVWRHEEKYLVSEHGFTRLFWQLRPFLTLDAHAGTVDCALDSSQEAFCQYPGYQVRSLYFDTSERHALFEKLAGVDHRFKYRIRVYNNEDRVIHLEKKMKRNSYCLKESIPLSRPEVEALLQGDIAWLLDKGPLGQELYADMRTRLMAPLVLVDYHRIPFTWQADEIRITFDRQLSTGLFRTDLFDPNAALHPVLPPGETILEVKYNHFLPDFLRSLLTGPGMVPTAMSKYAMCSREITPAAWGDPQETWETERAHDRHEKALPAARERIEWHE